MGSDADLLVVITVVGSKRKQAIEIDMALADVGMPKDVMVVTPDDVTKCLDVVGGTIYPAIHEERVLYERVA